MSKTTVIYPMVTALIKAEEIIGPQRYWRAVNSQQTRFLTEFFTPCRQESGSIEEIESIAAFTAEQINYFLREHGFQIALKPLRDTEREKEFGIASVLDLLVSWFESGNETTIRGQRDQRDYPGVHLSKRVCQFFRSVHHKHVIVRLQTQSSDEVYLTKLDESLAGFELFRYAQQLAGSLTANFDHDSVMFPMVELKQEEDVSWLSDLHTTTEQGYKAKVAQALQETHLAINQEGAHAKSAFAGSVVIALSARRPLPPLVIDEPFLVWFQRPQLSKPLFVSWITEENWKNPGLL